MRSVWSLIAVLFRSGSPQSVPRWLGLALVRSHRVGRSRLVTEAWLLVTVVLAVVGLAISPLTGLMPQWWHLAALAGLSALVVVPMMLTVLPVMHALSSLRLRMRKVATHDERTGIVNRRHFTQMAYREWERCRRYRSGAALLMVEADKLQSLEEERGRQARDAVMRAIALACDSMLRKPDLLGQHGASSLVVFLPHTDTLGAIDVAERIRALVAQQRTPWQNEPLRVTVSVGVATLGDQHLSLNALVLDAESALAAAQDAGRNCVRTAPSPPSHRGQPFPVMP
jgi:diguanylate cyclase